MISYKSEKRLIYISDIHYPFQVDSAVNLAFKIIKDVDPHYVFIGGDLIDFYSISSWMTDPRAINTSAEIQESKEFLKYIRDLCPFAKIYYKEGNHEYRLPRYIFNNSPKLSSLVDDILSIEALLDLSKFNIEYLRNPIRIGHLIYLHGHEKRASGQTIHIALNMLRKFNRNIIFGHFHKFDSFYITSIEGSIYGSYLNGCLFDPTLMPTKYSEIDDTQKGISVVSYYGDIFHVEQMLFLPLEKDRVRSGSRDRGYVCVGRNYFYEEKIVT